MQDRGISERTILKELESKLQGDFTYSSGKIVGSMCTPPYPLARKIYANFLEKNLGDSGLFPGTAEIEKEAVHMIGTLLSNPQASGNIVTGGTEANVLAMWAAKKLARKTNCEVVVPSSVHCSFDKAADLLSLKMVKAGLNDRFQVDVEAVKKAINPRTVAIVGIAGTTALGAVDSIEELSELALEKNLFLHVDGAFGGFVLPFLRELGYEVPEFDFKLPGVCSIAVDPHKMGLGPIPAGGLLFRDEILMGKISLDIPYLSGGESEQATLVGTRSGASAIATWATMKNLGRKGYRKMVRHCMNLTMKIAEEIQNIYGLDIVTEPMMNIVGLKSDLYDIRIIAKELRHRKWAISLFPNHIRIVIMPHVKSRHIEELLQDLKSITSELRS